MKKEEKEKHDPEDALLANRFGFIKVIIERWKIDGQNIFRSNRGFLIHNGAFEVLISEDRFYLNQYLKLTIMNMKTLEAPKDILAVNFPSLNDGFYEAESIRQKRVCRVIFDLLFIFHSSVFIFIFYILYVLEYVNHLSVPSFFMLGFFFLLVSILHDRVEYFIKW
jgi:hypothetical protein